VRAGLNVVMFKEFFASGPAWRCAFAYFGLLSFLGHQLFKAYLKYEINSFYEGFYDLLQTSVERGSGDEEVLASLRSDVAAQLLTFAGIVAPMLAIHPLATLVRNAWVLSWRIALTKSYLAKWNPDFEPLEGASQRVHEDAQRFGAGIHTIVASLLESALTLAVFCPILYDVDALLMYVAVGAAAGGLAISAFAGKNLVGLEVQNQAVEAALRRELVILETDPISISARGSIPAAFSMILANLRKNYVRLYTNYAVLQTWLTTFDQTMVILPYAIVAPRLFAMENAITLGIVVKVTNSFGKVFDSFNVISENWLQLNEFLSVVRRLRGFEESQSQCRHTSTLVRPSEAVHVELCI